MKRTNMFRIASILFRVVGCGAVAGAVYFLVANTVFWLRAESTTGTVVGSERMEGIRKHSGDLMHRVDPARAAVVEFVTAAGDTVVFVSDVGSATNPYATDEEVVVLYKPDDPENAKIRSFSSLYLGPVLLVVMGAVLGLVGVLLQFFYEPARARQRA